MKVERGGRREISNLNFQLTPLTRVGVQEQECIDSNESWIL